MSNLKVVIIAGSLSTVEVQNVIAKRLSCAIGKIAAAVTPEGIRQAVACGFQMTL